jgi:hypothetical protein
LLGHENGSSGITLVDLVGECLASMNPSESQIFRSKLARVGFSESDGIATSQLFEAELPKYFNAQAEDFPKIIAAEIPASVAKVSYSLSIPQLEPFALLEIEI